MVFPIRAGLSQHVGDGVGWVDEDEAQPASAPAAGLPASFVFVVTFYVILNLLKKGSISQTIM